MRKLFIKSVLFLFACAAVGYPLFVRINSLPWNNTSNLIPNLFPLFGLAAFALLWLHALSGVFEPWLRKQVNFDRFVSITASLILISIIMHPLLALMNLNFSFANLFLYGKLYIWLGIIGWLLLITYDAGKLFKRVRVDFFAKNWNKILIISNTGFVIIFFHSLYLGSDLQINPLRAIWIFYGVTAIAALVYTYGIKKFLYKS